MAVHLLPAHFVTTLVHRLGPAGVALGAGLEGETAVLIGGAAARHGLFNPVAAGLAAFAGSFVADQLVFWISREQRHRPFVQNLAAQPRVTRALALIDRRPLLFCCGFRFVYGFRIAGPAAVGLSTVPGRLFVLCNAVSAAVWAALFTFAGYRFGGALLSAIRPLLHLPHLVIELAVFVAVLALVLFAWARRKE